MFSLQILRLTLCVPHQHSLTRLNNRTEGTMSRMKGKPLQDFKIFDSQGVGLGSHFQGAPWVCESSGQTLILSAILINALLFPFTLKGQKMRLVYEFILPCITTGGSAGQRMDGQCSPPHLLLLSTQKGFFFLPCERPISNESVKWRRQLICEFRFYKVTSLWWAV